MKENQPLPELGGKTRDCSNCAFAVQARLSAADIRTRLICRFNPPQMVPSFTQTGMTINVMQPPVDETMLCNQHRFRSEIANAKPDPEKEPAN